MDKNVRWLGLVIILAALQGGALAQGSYPDRALRIIAPVPPASPPDVVARIVAEPLSRFFGKPVVVENRPGANQTLGLAAVAAAPADGYTLGMVSLPTAVVPSLIAKMPYDTLRDLAAVREIAWTSNVLIVRAPSGPATVNALVAAANTGGKITFASGGNGTPAHVMGELFREQARLSALHVPFKGAPDGVNAVVAGHVEFMLASAGAVLPHLKAGKILALAQTTGTRLPALPAVATFAELGYPEIVVRDWQGIVAPAATPPSVLKRLADALGETLARPETRERLAALALEPVADSDPAAFAAFLASEVARWSALARKINLQAQ